MIKNILVISSTYTGHGHKSIGDSLNEQFSKHPGVNVHVIDGFTLGGNIGLRIGKMYGSITRNARELWKWTWEISLKNPSFFNEFTETMTRNSFLKLIEGIKPDLILSIHPNFNGPMINILEENNLHIPFVILLADLVSISPLWADPRADCIICPTQESKEKCIEFGVPESRLKVIGFPSRAKFCEHIGKVPEDNSYNGDRPLECLIMSGGEGVGNMSRIAKILLKNFDCKVKIIAGRNRILKRRLELTLMDKYKDRVEIYGFLENVQDVMRSSDVAFTRGSPNVIMEAVCCALPLVITGALPGQEEGNPGYVEKYNLGVICKELRRLEPVVADLLANDAQKLNQIKKVQREFRNPTTAKSIVDFILSIDQKREPDTFRVAPKLERFERI